MLQNPMSGTQRSCANVHWDCARFLYWELSLELSKVGEVCHQYKYPKFNKVLAKLFTADQQFINKLFENFSGNLLEGSLCIRFLR